MNCETLKDVPVFHDKNEKQLQKGIFTTFLDPENQYTVGLVLL